MSNISSRLASLRELAKPAQIVNESGDGDKHQNFASSKYNKNTPPDGTLTKIKLLIDESTQPGIDKPALIDKVDQGIISPAVIAALAASPKAETKFGLVYLEDEDINWLNEQAKVADELDFENWFATNYHFNQDGMGKAFAAKLNPGYYQDRLKEFNRQLQLISTVKKIQLLGPQSEDDLIVQWALEEGRIKLADNWDKIGITATGAVTGANVTRNVKEARLNAKLGRWMGQNQRKTDNGTSNQAKTGMVQTGARINKYGTGARDLMVLPGN